MIFLDEVCPDNLFEKYIYNECLLDEARTAFMQSKNEEQRYAALECAAKARTEITLWREGAIKNLGLPHNFQVDQASRHFFVEGGDK